MRLPCPRGADAEDAAEAASVRCWRPDLGWAMRAMADPALLDERARMLDRRGAVAHAGRSRACLGT